MAISLTALGIENEKPSATRREVPDAKVRGLFFIVQPTGRRSWAFRYRNKDGVSRKHTLGAYPALTLEAARRLAARARATVAEGGDPAAAKASRRAAAKRAAHGDTVEAAVKGYLERQAKPRMRPTTYVETDRILRRELVERWGKKPVTAVRKADIRVLLDAIVDRGAPIAANRSLEAIRPFFSWALQRDLIPVSPCDGLDLPSPKKERERVLSLDELRAVWHAADRSGYPFGPITKLLILTAQRRGEVGGLAWAELDLNQQLWSLPRGRAKNAKGHVIPLSPQALRVINNIPVVDGGRALVFAAGKTPPSGYGRAKRRLDKLLAEAKRQVEPWTLHDLRRSAATHIAALGTSPHVLEAILNHRSGTIKGVGRIYNRHDYLREKIEALNAWGAQVERLVCDEGAANVVELKAMRW